MALVGINTKETTRYVPKCEEGQENPTTFVLGILKNKDKLKLGGSLYSAEDKGLKQAEMAWEMMKLCVKRIENVIDPETKQLAAFDKITDDVLCMLSDEIILEVAGKIAEFNKLSAAEQGN